MESALEIKKTIDTSGMSCPVPLLKTKKALKDLDSGDILKIISTDPGSEKDLPKFGNKGGNTYIGKDDVNGVISHFIKKG